jgi:two-component system cell cycle response regulator DivK
MSAERILIVDDDLLNVRITRSFLQREGYEVRTASEGRQALVMSATFKPQLILTDTQLPFVDGLELTRRLKADPTSDAAVIALTAYAMKGGEKRALEAGCDAFLAKPLDTHLLLETVRQQLDCRSRRIRMAIAGTVGTSMPVSGESAEVVDVEDFKARVGDDRVLMGELISLFLMESPKLAAATRNAALEKNGPALRTAAHTFKGMVANFSASRAFHAVSVLEELGGGNDLSNVMNASDALDTEVAALCSELSRIAVEVAA